MQPEEPTEKEQVQDFQITEEEAIDEGINYQQQESTNCCVEDKILNDCVDERLYCTSSRKGFWQRTLTFKKTLAFTMMVGLCMGFYGSVQHKSEDEFAPPTCKASFWTFLQRMFWLQMGLHHLSPPPV
nr:PREDICTED: uncharacterized protein LOC106702892 [Latimeria chalumnae]|eukprot:XP_014342012.1 PREDICTED: uncharacterized protein LOC106702892 [Latimeria chalumnae]